MQMRHISFAIATIIASTAVQAAPNAFAGNRAQGLIDSHPGWVNRASGDTFVQHDAVVDADGSEHVRFDRYYNGLPVIGGDVVVHSKDGNLRQTSHTLLSKNRPGLKPTVSADDAQVAAGVKFNGTVRDISSKGLVVYARGAAPVLAYEINVVGTNDHGYGDMRYFVDARTGQVLDGWNRFQTAAASGTGKTLFVGNVGITTNSSGGKYQMTDPTRGNGNTRDGGGKNIDLYYLEQNAIMTDADNVWGNNSTSSVASSASDAYYGIAKTWDFYKNTFARNGIKNDGTGVTSVVNVVFCYNQSCSQSGGGNAGWYGASRPIMAYGKGDSTWYPVVALDVAGHEMTHGVTEATAGLAYSGDAGGLNESTSDIMGTMVEFYAANASDPGDYMIGEKIWRSNPSGTTALRYMFKPSRDGGSVDCYSSSVASLDPHYSSGVGNHFFYLLAQGAVSPSGFSYTPSQLVCNGNTAAGGIGRDAAQKIWYKALTTYMTANTTYPQARTATLNAARDLYGTGSTQYNAVASAWSAVSVN